MITMKQQLTLLTKLVLENGHDVHLVELTKKDGKTIPLSSKLVLSLPDCYATERNQILYFINNINITNLAHMRFIIAKEFNKVRRTLLRDVLKLNSITSMKAIESKVEKSDKNGNTVLVPTYSYNATFIDLEDLEKEFLVSVAAKKKKQNPTK
jgi:hypothetical protein